MLSGMHGVSCICLRMEDEIKTMESKNSEFRYNNMYKKKRVILYITKNKQHVQNQH